MKTHFRVGLLVMSLSVGGCATDMTVNHPFDTSALAGFHAGVTTMADVQRVYGAPTRTETNSANGHIAWLYVYGHVHGNAFMGNTQHEVQGIVFIFDANGRMIRNQVNNTQATVQID
jgi:outer membrane protein assembly factor BamE (lipoprotein component of BamABCDE complex)